MNTQREGWAKFIGETGHADRYLRASGNATYRESVGDSERIADFLDRLGRANADAKLVIRLYFLLQPRVGKFFRHALPALIRSASHVATGGRVLSRRGGRAKILWHATIQARLCGRATRGAFVVRQTTRSPDVPENQLLVRFLADVVGTITRIRLLVGTGALLLELDDIHRHAAAALRTIYLRKVTVPNRVTSLMRQRARRHRVSHYRALVDIQSQFERVLIEDKWQSVVRLLRKGWLEPISDDDLFELYVLMLVIVVLEHDLEMGAPKPGLIRRGRKQVAIFDPQSKGVRIEVFFDQSPATQFGFASRYRNTIDTYAGIGGSGHRPDITLRIDAAGGEVCTVFVEAKQTCDGGYMRDSVYKVLGYLKDFEEVWEANAGQRPKAVLVFPETSDVIPTGNEDELELILAVGTRERMGVVLSSVLPL